MSIQVDVLMNRWGDTITIVGDEYVIYDKIDRAGVETLALSKGDSDKSLEELRKVYYDNGFRLVDDSINCKSTHCHVCEHFGCCAKDGGCCGDDILSKPCCTCTRGKMCPGSVNRTDNFKLKD